MPLCIIPLPCSAAQGSPLMSLQVLLSGQPMCLVSLSFHLHYSLHTIVSHVTKSKVPWSFAGTCIASSLMDKQGRKSLLMISFSGMVKLFLLFRVGAKYIRCISTVFNLRLSWVYYFQAASMLLLSLSFTWSVLAPFSGTLAVVGTVL